MKAKTQVKMVKCSYSHCRHESCELSQDSAVKINNRYMHEDCAKDSKNIQLVKDIYYQDISNTVVITQLVSVLNNLVFKKNVDSEFLLFAIKHCVSSGIPIKSPYGLHYIVGNNKIKELWQKKQSEIVARQIRESMESTPDRAEQATSFSYSPDTNTGFGGILKGGT